MTSGPTALSGPIGSQLGRDMWTERVVTFKPVNGKVTELPEHVVADFSNDQKLAYFYAIGVQTGKLPDDVARKVNSAQIIIQ